MGERPVLFSGPMIRAILDGRKTMTRRTVNDRLHLIVDGDEDTGRVVEQSDPSFGRLAMELVPCPYGIPGDRLWVRETILRVQSFRAGYAAAEYAADGAPAPLDSWPWKVNLLPSIYCPRGLSRIKLDVSAIRVERLQDITEADAIAEGVELGKMQPALINGERGEVMIFNPRKAYAVLWDRINAKRAPWASNPWCWCISFKRSALDLGDGEEG